MICTEATVVPVPHTRHTHTNSRVLQVASTVPVKLLLKMKEFSTRVCDVFFKFIFNLNYPGNTCYLYHLFPTTLHHATMDVPIVPLDAHVGVDQPSTSGLKNASPFYPSTTPYLGISSMFP